MKATNVYQSLKSKGVCGTDGMKPKLPGIGSPLKKSPYKFNAGLKKAAADGKLDNNPKFKDAVESSPAKMYKDSAAKMYKDSPAKKYKSDAQRKAVHASKAEKASPAKNKAEGKTRKEVKAQSITYDPASKTTTRTFSDADVKKYNVKKQIVTKAKIKSPAKKKYCSSPAAMKDNGKKAKLISEKTDPKTGVTTKKYDVGTNMPRIVKTKKSPAKMELGGGKGQIRKAKRQAKKQQRKRSGQSCLSARYKK